MTDDDEFWRNRFHHCALAAGFLAAGEGRLADAHYVRELAYEFYEQGAFRERATTRPLTSPPGCATAWAFANPAEPNHAPQEESPIRNRRAREGGDPASADGNGVTICAD